MNWARGPQIGTRGICVGLNGRIYVRKNTNEGPFSVEIFNPDGTLRESDFLKGLGWADCGIGVDAKGNIYVGANLKPAKQPFPKPFMGKIPAKGWAWWRKGKREVPWHYMYLYPYLFHWGSVFKFPPSGGAIYGNSQAKSRKDRSHPNANLSNAPPEAVSYRSAYLGREVKVAGALWHYQGFGNIPSSQDGPGPDPGCVCWNSRLAVDLYGRVFAANVFRFSVEMLDTNGNQIGRIGRYGNADSAGPKSKVPEPEIAFAWPAYVSVAGGKLYVSDPSNRRVTVVRFDHAAADEVRLP